MPSDEICFHCQQAVEKFLKALLQEAAVAFYKTHNLEALGKLLLPQYASLVSVAAVGCNRIFWQKAS